MANRLKLHPYFQTAAEWTADDYTLLRGEIGFESDTGNYKIGDGETKWSALAIAGRGKASVDALINGLQGQVDAKASISPSVREITDAASSITQANNGEIIYANSAVEQTITLEGEFAPGFNCLIIQADAGQTVFEGDIATLVNRQGHNAIAGEGGIASLVCPVANMVYLAGDTAAA